MTDEALKVDTTWFSIFRTTIASGDMAKMGPYAFAVYCVIKTHANFTTGNAFPSIELISELSGISNAQVRREIHTLENIGYLLKQKIGRSNLYRVKERVGISDLSGNLHAVADWDYRPNHMMAAIDEIKNTVSLGDLTSGRIVNIEKLTVINNVNSGSGTQININGNVLNSNDLAAIVAMMSEGELKEGMKSLIAKIATKKISDG